MQDRTSSVDSIIMLKAPVKLNPSLVTEQHTGFTSDVAGDNHCLIPGMSNHPVGTFYVATSKMYVSFKTKLNKFILNTYLTQHILVDSAWISITTPDK